MVLDYFLLLLIQVGQAPGVVVFTLLSLLYIHKYYVQLLYDHNEHTLASCNVHV
jgi:hypothetical protein